MGVFRVVFVSPLFDHHTRFGHAQEQFLVEAFIAQAIVKGLYMSILPRAPWFNVYDVDLLALQFSSDLVGYKLRSVVRADALGFAVVLYGFVQDLHHVGTFQ